MAGRPIQLVLAAFVVAALVGCGGAQRWGGSRSDRDESAAFERILRDGRGSVAVGVSAAVVERGRLRWSGGSGVGDLRERRPVTGSTVFGLGSVTKTFVAALALQKSQQGVLDLDASAARWFPGSGLDAKITVRRLLNHTSGLFGVDENPAYIRAVDRERHRRWTPEQTLRYVRRPYFAPGKGWHYSDTNYVLAGLVIERATRSSVAAQMQSSFFEPLRLLRTGVQPQVKAPPTAAHAYGDPQRSGTIRDLSRGMRWIPYDSLASTEWTSGGMFASAEDVARFGDALFTGELLKPSTIKEMTDWVEGVGFESYLGYGLGIGKRFDPDAGGELWGSLGRIPGFKADLWHVPSRGRTVAVLANDDRIDTTAVADALLHEADARR